MPVYILYPYLACVMYLLFRRIKDGIGFQQYARNKLWGKIVLFSGASALTIFISITRPVSLIGDVAGIIAGLGLTYLATRNMRFEHRKNGLYYRTSIFVELSVLLLFFARFLFRFYTVYRSVNHVQSEAYLKSKILITNDPYTGAAVLVLCSYYVSYYLVVLKKGKH